MANSNFTYKATWSNNAGHTYAPAKAIQITSLNVTIGVASAAVENLVITLDSAAGAAYDKILMTQAMAGVTSIVSEILTLPYPLAKGDEIVVTYANTDSRDVGLDIQFQGV